MLYPPLHTPSEADENAARRAEEEDRRQLAESRQREDAVVRKLKDNEDEGQKLRLHIGGYVRQNVYAIKTVVEEKEAQRMLETDKRRALELEGNIYLLNTSSPHLLNTPSHRNPS